MQQESESRKQICKEQRSNKLNQSNSFDLGRFLFYMYCVFGFWENKENNSLQKVEMVVKENFCLFQWKKRNH